MMTKGRKFVNGIGEESAKRQWPVKHERRSKGTKATARSFAALRMTT